MPAPSEKAEPPFWKLSLTALMERLDSGPYGSSSAEAADLHWESDNRRT